MKLFNNRKRKEPINQPLMVRDSAGWPDSDSGAMHSDYAVHMQAQWDRTFEKERRMEEEYNNRKNLGGWVKTLNCAASRKGLSYDDTYHVESARKPAATPWVTESKPWMTESKDADITRPVVITVKDGDVPRWQPSTKKSSSNDFKTSITVGESPKTPTRFTMFRRGSKKLGSPGSQNEPTPYSFSRDMNDVMTSEEIARRTRWRKGIKKSWKDDGDIPSLVSQFEDGSVATGCRSTLTGVDSFATGFTNATAFSRGTSNTNYSGYTTDMTEDSYESDPYRRHSTLHAPSRNISHDPARRRATTGSSSRRTNSSLKSGDSLLAGVAEDLGIIAGLLLSDVAACGGGVANITKESVSSCKGVE